ncbi:MAG: sulfotransferase domain-containing protein [Pseudomonadota bacterium]
MGQSIIPDFVVIGAMRAGTTTLHELLKDTGCVSLSNMKEIDYFMTADRFARGDAWFRKRFKSYDAPVGDISPNYAKRDVFPGVAERIHRTNPHAKLVYIVRDPVDRAISQYRIAKLSHQNLRPDETFLDHDQGQHIIRTSQYAYQLEPYLEYWSLDDILLLDFNDLWENPTLILNQIFDKIGLDPLREAVSPIHSNATTDVGRLPKWWLSLRKTKLGETIRSATPRPLAARLKNTLSASRVSAAEHKPNNQFSDLIASALASDTEIFRRLTGRRFKNWSV